MKIILVHNAYQQPGGEDVVFEQEKRLLERAGNDVIAYRRSNNEISSLGVLGHLALVPRSIWARDTEREFANLLARVMPDVVHVHNTYLMISPSIYRACHVLNVPVVQTLHNFRVTCASATLFRDGKVCEECLGHRSWRGVYHGCYRNSRVASAGAGLMIAIHRRRGTLNRLVTSYIALTQFARNKFVAAGLDPEKIVVKPNFVESDPGKRWIAAPYALFVGRLSAEKGPSTLLRAWRVLHRSFPLQIIGDGPEREQLERMADQPGLASIRFRGRLSREETMAAIREARFLIVPSGCYENFPMCIAEAFACGTPVICSKLGALEELVRDGQTGLHFVAGDAADLAAKAEWAFSHDSEMAEMGRIARRVYETHYTASLNYSLLMDIYRQAIATSERRKNAEECTLGATSAQDDAARSRKCGELAMLP